MILTNPLKILNLAKIETLTLNKGNLLLLMICNSIQIQSSLYREYSRTVIHVMTHVCQIIITVNETLITIYITLKSKYFHKSRYLLQTEYKTDEGGVTLTVSA